MKRLFVIAGCAVGMGISVSQITADQNLIRINEHNANTNSFKLDVGPWIAHTEDEYMEAVSGCYRSRDKQFLQKYDIDYSQMDGEWSSSSEDVVFDWREIGGVSNIKDEGEYGNCYAFSVTAALENALYRKNKEAVSLSEQQIVDCSRFYNTEGGVMEYVFDDINNGKLEVGPETAYPYKGPHAPCISRKGIIESVDYLTVAPDYKSFINAVQEGVLTVAVDASSFVFEHYSSGIIDSPSCFEEGLNHGVSIIGFGRSNGTVYAIMRNSWGQWGESGYARVEVYPKDVCGILKEMALVKSVNARPLTYYVHSE